MFEREEKELVQSRNEIEKIMISEELADQAILKGIQKAKAMQLKKNKTRPFSLLLSASLIFLSFFLTIHTSESAAKFFANIPGLEQVISKIRNDTGLLAAAENNYIQKVGMTKEHTSGSVTIDSIIHDEKSLIVFFTGENSDTVLSISLLDDQQQPLDAEYKFEQTEALDISDTLESRTLTLTDPQDTMPDEINIRVEVNTDKIEYLTFPVTLDKEKAAKKKEFELNETVTVAGQQLTFTSIEIYPTMTAVHVKYPEENSMEIFGFNDLQLSDEHGNVWSQYPSEPAANTRTKNEEVVILESSYFTESEKLYLQFTSLRALDKKETSVVIDADKEQFIKTPSDGLLSDVYIIKDDLYIRLDTNSFENLIFPLEEMKGSKGGGYGIAKDADHMRYSLPYNGSQLIHLNLVDYPAEIERKTKIEIK
ncbi:DUF4179 domain-containing protein [Cytobacillus gottheilii]|uniref:DUF4179 domain-containing protein n=1 Tax=Cytobacillus gottheilii TaxID=859144 RepID=UPI002494810E|nr:DUF4179 domain-containing protein [Cytobacillus gottheilii]